MKNPSSRFSIPLDESIVALGMLQADQLASGLDSTPALADRRVAVLASDGVDEAQLNAMKAALEEAGAQVEVVSHRSGALRSLAGATVAINHHWLDMPSVMFDAVYVPGGDRSVQALKREPDALTFMQEAYEQGKSLAATGQGAGLLEEVGVAMAASGVVTDRGAQALERVAEDFVAAIIKDRHWRRHADPRGAITAPPCPTP